MGAAINHPVHADWVTPSFVIFDIRSRWRSGLSIKVPGCQKLQMMAGLTVTGCFIAAPIWQQWAYQRLNKSPHQQRNWRWAESTCSHLTDSITSLKTNDINLRLWHTLAATRRSIPECNCHFHILNAAPASMLLKKSLSVLLIKSCFSVLVAALSSEHYN